MIKDTVNECDMRKVMLMKADFLKSAPIEFCFKQVFFYIQFLIMHVKDLMKLSFSNESSFIKNRN